MPSLLLAHAPLVHSIHVYLNGVEQYEGTDWEYLTTPPRVHLLTPMDARANDLVEARYAYEDATAYATSHSLPTGGWVTPGAPGSAVAPPTIMGGLCTNPLDGAKWAAAPTGWTATFDGSGDDASGATVHAVMDCTPPGLSQSQLIQTYDLNSATGCIDSGDGAGMGAFVPHASVTHAVPAGKRLAGVVWGHYNGTYVEVWAMVGFYS